jgi:membrane protein implicated in regulation of membrane protease activity
MGQVMVRGEIWRAMSRSPLAAGTPVLVKAIEGLTLIVEAADVSPHEGGSP